MFAQKHLREWVEATGIADVQERVVDCFMGAKNKNGDLAKRSAWATEVGTKGLVGFAKCEFPLLSYLGMCGDQIYLHVNSISEPT